MKLIGLTGSIASGKSVASSHISDMGYVVIDADLIAHEITKKDGEGLKKIVENFGSDLLFEDGNLDRKKLSDIVFNDGEKLKLLNSILHPVIFKNIDLQIEKNLDEKFVFLDAPLLFESDLYKKCDLILLITTDEKTQIDRIIKRDKVDEKKARLVIKNQMSKEEKVKRSDFVIDNSSTIKKFIESIDEFLLNMEKESL